MELEARVLKKLLENNLHVSFVESCTGGMLASRFIGANGASGAIEQSFITYSNKAKHELVGVSTATIEKYGAISSQTAVEMAVGGAKKAHSDVCLSVTGNAGPDASEGKPVGLVYLGMYFDGATKYKELMLSGNRQQIREKAVESAFDFLLEQFNN